MTTAPLAEWLQQVCPYSPEELQAIPGDASFRRYFRLKQARESWIVMDASQQMDAVQPFVAIAKALAPLGVRVPDIKAADLDQGYMLISDFGDRLYLKELNEANVDRLYQNALQSLLRIQACQTINDFDLPHFNHEFMRRELEAFQQWFLEGYLKLKADAETAKMLEEVFARLIEGAEAQEQVFIHRDYHSANIMLLEQPPFQVGVLDFQDACRGPVTYDLVSLLRDCYIDWPDQRVEAWVSHYHLLLQEQGQLTALSREQFQRDFDLMGLQRHMKALFIFARKYLRDEVPRYLQYLPRTMGYVHKISARYPEFKALHHYAEEQILPAMARVEKEILACAR